MRVGPFFISQGNRPCVEADVSEWSSSKAYHVMTSLVAPRPIAWVTTLNEDGSTNLAPFSWFQSVCADPPMVMIAFADRDNGTLKDTPANIQRTGEFVIQCVTKDWADAMVATSAPLEPGESEVELAGLKVEPAKAVAPPRIAGAVAHMECRFVERQRFGTDEHGTTVIVGEVVHVHIRDDAVDERGSLRPDVGLMGRLGGTWYTAVTEPFQVKRPVG